ncbi:lysine-specific demethylase JMJ703-like isoform X3 [Dioscorea cayenensis subsp. rotundata]|nr:lysine-specific demethylase JMJ703-like isoform X3 [Dioscorea cayenensis subsp. rotundata]
MAGGASSSTQNLMDIGENERFKKSLRWKPWLNYSQPNDSLEGESESEPVVQDAPSVSCLPKGILHGCVKCENCQKVMARWRPENASRPILDEAPVFYPTEEEFKDLFKYISSIRLSAEPYGICRIVPPPSWRPPCPLKEKNVWENSKFPTHIQQLHKLQNHDSAKTICRDHSTVRKKRQKLWKSGAKFWHTSGNNGNAIDVKKPDYHNDERFGFEAGPCFTLESFQRYADDFKEQYFRTEDEDIDLGSRQWEPSVANIEGEYWRIVESPTEEIEVLYGSELDTGDFGSGFPKSSFASVESQVDERYLKSSWNLNNSPRLPGSVLSYENESISGILVPWLYIGMCFSSFCWHVEDHHLYSLNYLHWGAPKIWYGIAGRDALKLEAAMKKHLLCLFEEQPNLLYKLATQFSPTLLKMEGVPIYRCVQNSGEFVLTFPRAYHSGLSCGFNCAEAVNVAPFDWLPHGHCAIELYREQQRKISISHDKLLLGAAAEAVRAQWDVLLVAKDIADNSIWKDACGLDGILVKALKARIELERLAREYLCSASRSGKMTDVFIANKERECVVCHYDLYLSVVGCPCSPDRFACLIHAKELCSCAWKTRFFLFRYEISELNVLLDALVGKLSAIHRWGSSQLGLSAVSKPFVIDPLRRIKGMNEKPVTEGSSTGSQLSDKTFMMQADSLEEPKRKVYRALSSGDSTVAVGAHSLSCQHPESVVEKPCPQSRSMTGVVEDQIIQATGRSSDLKSSGLNLHFQEVHRKVPAAEGIIILSDDEDEGDNEVLSSVTKKEWKSLEAPARLPRLYKVTSSGSEGVNINQIPKSTASEVSLNVRDSLPNQHIVDRHSTSIFLAARDHQNGATQPEELSNLNNPEILRSLNQTRSHMKPVTTHNQEHASHAALISDATEEDIVNIVGESDKAEISCFLHCVGEGERVSLEGKESESSSTSILPSGLNRGNHLVKDSCMAEVLPRINCNVKPLEYGVVMSGKLWSSSQSIFPKGYRSRVQYLNILDPTQMCDYISEILDAGLLGPLFMVTLEQCPSEVFIHVSASKCWELVRERVNSEISRQRIMGRFNLSSLEPLESIDGLKMFGLTSPDIIQAIEARDHEHVCTKYWQSKASRRLISREYEHSHDREESSQSPSLPSGNNVVLTGLFKKANPEELDVLFCLINGIGDGISDPHKQEAVKLLIKEIRGRSR